MYVAYPDLDNSHHIIIIVAMPISPKHVGGHLDPFSGCMVNPLNLSLSATQASVLKALVPDDTTVPVWDWPMWNRAELGRRAGFTAVSGSLSRVLKGISADNFTSGKPHPGLLARGFIKEVPVELESKVEVNYQATEAGARAYQAYVASGRKHIPRDKASSVNTDRGYNNPHLKSP